ncbi:MAG: hypothetical protein V4496_06825 [Pseudomonadota bacterium]
MLRKCDPTGYLGFYSTLIFSLIYLFYTLGWSFISGHSIYWAAQNPEFNQHLSGVNLYIASSWQFPLLAFDMLHYPSGTRVTFTDSIPIYAFLLKIFLPRNIEFINPLGYWVALNFICQGIAAWWITKELRVKSWMFLAFLMIAFLTYPAWMDRLRQIALMSHWLILFAIALYIRGCRQQLIPRWGWTALIASAFYIHIYLFAMVVSIFVAAIFDAKQCVTRRYFISILLPFLVLAISLFLFLLPLPPAVHVGGHLGYPMDLLAPFYGGNLIELQASIPPLFTDINYNYLGLSVIIMLLWVVFSHRFKKVDTISNHPALFIILMGFFIYSLSDKIYFGGQLVAVASHSKFLDPITTQFRAAERFFWPVGYVIVVFSLYKLYKQLKPRNFTIIIALLLIIQCIDISHYYEKLRLNSSRQVNPVLDYAALDNVLDKQIKYVYLYPKFLCNKNSGRLPYPGLIIIPLMRYAAEHQLTLNTGYIARQGSNCDNTAEEIAQSNSTESAYIFSKFDYKNLNQVFELFQEKANLVCENLETVYVCHF